MQALQAAWESLRYGGAMVYPFLFLGVLAIAVILDRTAAYFRCLRLPAALANLVETYGFSWEDLEQQLERLGPGNAYGRFLRVIADNRTEPAWWVESRACDEAGLTEELLNRGPWRLATLGIRGPLGGRPGALNWII